MDTRTPRARWESLVEEARWAPSPHNVQPWLLRPISRDSAEIVCPADRLLPNADPDGIFTACGIGSFVEGLAVAAAGQGLSLRAEPTGNAPGGDDPVVTVELAEGGSDELSPELLRRRRTSRLPYDGTLVRADLLEELAHVARGGGHEWRASSDPQLVRWVVGLNRETLFLDMSDPDARREVGRWLRFSAAEAERRRDGFSPDALGFPGWLLRLFFRRHRLLELPVVRPCGRWLYGRTTRGTSTVAWLRGPFETVEDGIAAGRVLMRLWLTMTRDGIQLHPFGSVVTNRVANARLQARIEPGEGTLWLVMRLGRSAEAPRSHRREADELVA